MSISRYAVVDGAGNVQGAVMWDGTAPYNPGPGLTLTLIKAGWGVIAGKLVPLPPPDSAGPTGPHYVPFSVVCDRVRTAGLWDAFTAMWQTLPAATQLHLQTLTQGVASDDEQVTSALASIGADPAVILA